MYARRPYGKGGDSHPRSAATYGAVKGALASAAGAETDRDMPGRSPLGKEEDDSRAPPKDCGNV